MLDYFHREFVPTSCTAVPGSALDRAQGHLPDELRDLWRLQGWCSYDEGRLVLVDPAEFTDVLADWGVSGLEGGHVFARNAFGDLFLWGNGTTWYLDIIHSQLHRLGIGMLEFLEGFLCDGQMQQTVLRNQLFLKAHAQLGPLPDDTVYTFVPLPALGGPGTVDSLKTGKIHEYLYLCAQVVAGALEVLE
ncbi:MAG: GAD-like domain-containing protein [Bacteroidota bacterium]